MYLVDNWIYYSQTSWLIKNMRFLTCQVYRWIVAHFGSCNFVAKIHSDTEQSLLGEETFNHN